MSTKRKNNINNTSQIEEKRIKTINLGSFTFLIYFFIDLFVD